jgi:hypothetical protein
MGACRVPHHQAGMSDPTALLPAIGTRGGKSRNLRARCLMKAWILSAQCATVRS